MRSPISNLEAYPNNTGPIPPKAAGGLHWRFVAYCDAEVDVGLYGYGHTEADACADYLRNCAEELCNGCNIEDECEDTRDCIFVEPNLSKFIADHIPLEYGGTDSNATHEAWKELNNEDDDDDIQF